MEKPLNSIWGWTSFGNPSSDQGISQVRWEVKDIYEKKVVGGGGGVAGLCPSSGVIA